MSLATARTMSMVLSLQITTAFLFITTTASSPPPTGFTMDLIQRRTNSSSSRRSNNTYDDQLQSSSPYADVVFETYLYLMKLKIGTPPVEFDAAIDTGSPIIWTQCLPCLHCYKQRNPIFDPSKSSTYKEYCNDASCDYDLVYEDLTYSKGRLATDTVTIQSTSGHSYVMPQTVIGCSHNSSGLIKSTASGIVGLSWESSSLISQMSKNMLDAFSYCFSHQGTSKISFGSNAIVSGDGTVSTPMFMKKENVKQGPYQLNLGAVSVGESRVETLGTPFHAVDGNIVIDSGSTFTYLPDSYLSLVRESVEKVVTAEKVDSDQMLCYKTNSMDVFPVITMHFSGGADLVLDKNNTYMAIDGQGICLIIMSVPITAGKAIFGNRAQNNFLVGYDRSSLQVSFKPTSDCGVTQDMPRDSTSAASFLQFNIKFVLFVLVLSLIRL